MKSLFSSVYFTEWTRWVQLLFEVRGEWGSVPVFLRKLITTCVSSPSTSLDPPMKCWYLSQRLAANAEAVCSSVQSHLTLHCLQVACTNYVRTAASAFWLSWIFYILLTFFVLSKASYTFIVLTELCCNKDLAHRDHQTQYHR